MDDLLDIMRAKHALDKRRQEEGYEYEERPPLAPAFSGREVPAGIPSQASTPFFSRVPGIHPDKDLAAADKYYDKYRNSSPETVERMLNEKEEAFCQHYAVTRNASASAREAGWKAGSARTIGYKLLMKNTVRQRIQHLMQFHQLNDQATPVHAMALVMSAIQGGPDPRLRISAARTIIEIYRTTGVSIATEEEPMLPARKNSKAKCQPPEPNLLANNTFIQINSPEAQTNVNQMSTNVNHIGPSCQPDVNQE